MRYYYEKIKQNRISVSFFISHTVQKSNFCPTRFLSLDDFDMTILAKYRRAISFFEKMMAMMRRLRESLENLCAK